MDRKEAYEGLFPAPGVATAATEEHLNVLVSGGDLLTDSDNAALDEDTFERASDFVADPDTYIATVADPALKTLLERLAQAMKGAAPAPPPPVNLAPRLPLVGPPMPAGGTGPAPVPAPQPPPKSGKTAGRKARASDDADPDEPDASPEPAKARAKGPAKPNAEQMAEGQLAVLRAMYPAITMRVIEDPEWSAVRDRAMDSIVNGDLDALEVWRGNGVPAHLKGAAKALVQALWAKHHELNARDGLPKVAAFRELVGLDS